MQARLTLPEVGEDDGIDRIEFKRAFEVIQRSIVLIHTSKTTSSIMNVYRIHSIKSHRIREVAERTIELS